MVTFFFLSFLEQDKHVTKCSSYIETIQPARIMTKYLPSYETKPPFMVSLKRMDPISGTLRGVSQSGQTFFFKLWWKANSAGSSHKKGKCRSGLVEVKGQTVCCKGQIHTLHYRAKTDHVSSKYYICSEKMQPCLLWITFTCRSFVTQFYCNKLVWY